MPRRPESSDFSDQPPAREVRKPEKKSYALFIGLAIAAACLLMVLVCGGIAATMGFFWLSAASVTTPPEPAAAVTVADDFPSSEMPLKTFLETRPAGPVLFQLKGKLSDYYNYAYRGTSDNYWSVGLVDGETFTTATGYVAKDSPDGKQLFELLKDGREHSLTLQLATTGPNGEHLGAEGSGSCIAIAKFVKGR
jgi:hypothetical protein